MFIFCFLFVGICMSFSPVTPPKSNRLRNSMISLIIIGGTDLSALRRAPYQSAKKTQYTEEKEQDTWMIVRKEKKSEKIKNFIKRIFHKG